VQQRVTVPLGRNLPGILRRAKQDPGLLAPAEVLTLQRTIGNQATIRLLASARRRQQTGGLPRQSPHARSGPADAYERKANSGAVEVMSIDSNLQRHSADTAPAPAIGKSRPKRTCAGDAGVGCPIQRDPMPGKHSSTVTDANSGDRSQTDPTAFLNRMLSQPNYIDNNIKEVSYFTAELATIHYNDGSELELGLVPRWMKPPFVEVDYNTPREGLNAIFDPKGELSLLRVSDLQNISGNMSWAEVQKRYARPVGFFAEGHSGRIVPSRVNMLTAPNLCKILVNSEKRYEEQVEEGVTLGLGIAKVMELQTLNPLFGTTISAVEKVLGEAVGKAAALTEAKVSVRTLSAEAMGRVIGWGEGRTAAAVAQTKAVTRALTTKTVKAMIERGLTKEFVIDQLTKYAGSFAKGGAKLKNAQLLPRMELMTKLLELWPK
ncbi:MAG TPA: hypothetical protein VI756_08770, partial [Blastocatellia bacterium]